MADDIADEINVYKLIQSHSVEINALKRKCKTKQCKQSQQRIPRHMRRRAASNNPKRLPKSMQKYASQSGATAEGSAGKKRRKKCKSRNVKRRNRDPKRTPLHLWFAKRFQLTLKWGILVPHRNNQKNQRLLYRCSRKGYTIFYLPFLRSLLLDFSSTSKDACLALLGHFLSASDVQSLAELKDAQQCTVHCHGHDRYPLALLGPLRCTLLEQQGCFLVSGHLATVEALTTELGPHLGESLSIRQPLAHSHIRLYGAKAAQHLNRLFFRTKQFLSDHLIPLNQLKCFRVQDKNKTPDSESTAEVSQFFSQAVTDSDQQPAIIACHRHLIGQLESIDLMVGNGQLRTIWNRLTENMSHLVGGLRDLEVLALETRSAFFPSIGYFDAQINQPTEASLVEPNRYAIREPSITATLSTLTVKNSGTTTGEEGASVYVTIEYVRGKPKQRDGVYLADTALLEAYLAGTVKVQQMKPAAGGDDSPIGFVEFGCFSLEAAKCRAVAAIRLTSLEQMITTQQRLQVPSKRLYAVVKTQFNIVHLVTVTVMRPDNLT